MRNAVPASFKFLRQLFYISNGDIFKRAVQDADCHDAVFYKQSERSVTKSCSKLPKKKVNKYVPELFAHHEQLNKFELSAVLN